MFADRKVAIRVRIISVLTRTLRLLPAALVRCFFESSLRALHLSGRTWITTHQRPKAGDAEYYLPGNPIELRPSEKYAIVLQGPIALEENFTVESIRYYRRMYPEAAVILSTWENEPAAAICACREAGADVVLSTKPATPGAINVNLQVRTSLAGMLRAKELNCLFAAKTRSDTRIFAPHAFRFLITLLQTFPCRKTNQQHARIISTNFVTARYTPFHLSDMFLFGEIDDMCSYWSSCENISPAPREPFDGTIRNIPPEKTPEMFLCLSFLQRTGGSYQHTIRSWWQALADRFLIVDRDMLDTYWPKYQPHTEHPSIWNELYLSGTNLYFRDWLRLYADFGLQSYVPEHLLDLPAKNKPPFQVNSSNDTTSRSPTHPSEK